VRLLGVGVHGSVADKAPVAGTDRLPFNK